MGLSEVKVDSAGAGGSLVEIREIYTRHAARKVSLLSALVSNKKTGWPVLAINTLSNISSHVALKSTVVELDEEKPPQKQTGRKVQSLVSWQHHRKQLLAR